MGANTKHEPRGGVMGEESKPVCPNPNCGSDQIDSVVEYSGRTYAWCTRCGTTLGEGLAQVASECEQRDAALRACLILVEANQIMEDSYRMRRIADALKLAERAIEMTDDQG